MFGNVQELLENPENYSVLAAFIEELNKEQAPRQGLEP